MQTDLSKWEFLLGLPASAAHYYSRSHHICPCLHVSLASWSHPRLIRSFLWAFFCEAFVQQTWRMSYRETAPGSRRSCSMATVRRSGERTVLFKERWDENILAGFTQRFFSGLGRSTSHGAAGIPALVQRIAIPLQPVQQMIVYLLPGRQSLIPAEEFLADVRMWAGEAPLVTRLSRRICVFITRGSPRCFLAVVCGFYFSCPDSFITPLIKQCRIPPPAYSAHAVWRFLVHICQDPLISCRLLCVHAIKGPPCHTCTLGQRPRLEPRPHVSYLSAYK